MTLLTPRRAALAALPLAAALMLSACGGSSGASGDGGGGGTTAGGRPSVDDLAKALTTVSSALPAPAASCMATAMEASTLSDDALRAIADDDPSYTASAADKKAASALDGKMEKCIEGVLPSLPAVGAGSASPQ